MIIQIFNSKNLGTYSKTYQPRSPQEKESCQLDDILIELHLRGAESQHLFSLAKQDHHPQSLVF